MFLVVRILVVTVTGRGPHPNCIIMYTGGFDIDVLIVDCWVPNHFQLHMNLGSCTRSTIIVLIIFPLLQGLGMPQYIPILVYDIHLSTLFYVRPDENPQSMTSNQYYISQAVNGSKTSKL